MADLTQLANELIRISKYNWKPYNIQEKIYWIEYSHSTDTTSN